MHLQPDGHNFQCHMPVCDKCNKVENNQHSLHAIGQLSVAQITT